MFSRKKIKYLKRKTFCACLFDNCFIQIFVYMPRYFSKPRNTNIFNDPNKAFFRPTKEDKSRVVSLNFTYLSVKCLEFTVIEKIITSPPDK